MGRRAKIVSTLGPATDGAEKVQQLVECGMDVARLNFSHGTHADHQQMYSYVRAASDATSKAVGILADLQGPKIRLGNFANGAELWATGEEVRITVADVEGSHDRVSTTYAQLAQDAKPGGRKTSMCSTNHVTQRLVHTGVWDWLRTTRIAGGDREVLRAQAAHRGCGLGGAGPVRALPGIGDTA